jgi:AraC family transcriptional regulator of adaptative response/methylated-DNA-[protein]-cysteine methyltransferase
MLRAFYERDPASEGIFFVGVRTTGIFCRPTCKARKPLAKNVEFFPDPSAALHAGFRPCKICMPMNETRPPPLVEKLRDAVELAPDRRLMDKELSTMGIDPSTARRQFKRHYGMTFQAYHRARRMGLALREVKDGARVIDAQLGSGFESASGFRDAFIRIFGEPPKNGAARTLLHAERITTPLGTMLAVAGDDGLITLDFVDRRGLERKLITLRKRLKCAVIPGEHPEIEKARAQLAEYFAGKRQTFELRLAPIGSEWEQSAWKQLQKIPSGETRSYGWMAAALGRAGASRAVGRANGMNFISIVIPCHRVIRSDGSLCGYGGGLWRKQWLINHERAMAKTLTTNEHE